METREHLFRECPARRFHTSRWVAPNGLRIKINFDAFAFAVEAMACFQELNLGLFLGLREVEIEIDSRLVIHKLQEENEDRS